MQTVKSGDTVKMHYTAKLEDGEMFDASKADQPVEIKVGTGQVIRGVDEELQGMSLNEKKSFTVAPDKAFGVRDESLQRSVARSALPPEVNPELGDFLPVRSPSGAEIPAEVKFVDDEKIVLDLNHPLAGRHLTFEVQIVAIEAAASA